MTFSGKYGIIVLIGETMGIEKNNIYLNYAGIMDTLKAYSSPGSKLTRMIKKGEVIKIKRGLYLPGNCTLYSTKTLANIIYGPSYISFEYALSYYGLIPEKVQATTSACYNKNKNKKFNTPVGVYIYQYVNSSVYPYGINRFEENNTPFLIASPEKALCDTLSKIRGITTINDLTEFLNDDLRIDNDEMIRLDINYIKLLKGIYKKKIITLLYKYLIHY